MLNSFFAKKIAILLFEFISPAQEYLYKRLFLSKYNFKIKLIYVNELFNQKNIIYISGMRLYYKNDKNNKLKPGEDYLLIGNSPFYNKIKNELINTKKVNLYEFENSSTIIYEKVK